MAALLVVAWSTVFVIMIRAVLLKDILWPQKQEDREEGGWKAQRGEILACDPRDCGPARTRSNTLGSRRSARSVGTGATCVGSGGLLGRDGTGNGNAATRRRLPGTDEPNLDMDDAEPRTDQEESEKTDFAGGEADVLAAASMPMERLVDRPIRPPPARVKSGGEMV